MLFVSNLEKVYMLYRSHNFIRTKLRIFSLSLWILEKDLSNKLWENREILSSSFELDQMYDYLYDNRRDIDFLLMSLRGKISHVSHFVLRD